MVLGSIMACPNSPCVRFCLRVIMSPRGRAAGRSGTGTLIPGQLSVLCNPLFKMSSYFFFSSMRDFIDSSNLFTVLIDALLYAFLLSITSRLRSGSISIALVIYSINPSTLSGIYLSNFTLLTSASFFNFSSLSNLHFSHSALNAMSDVGLNGTDATTSGYIRSYTTNIYLYIIGTLIFVSLQSFCNRRYTDNILKSD